jgi:hypothetical protein
MFFNLREIPDLERSCISSTNVQDQRGHGEMCACVMSFSVMMN